MTPEGVVVRLGQGSRKRPPAAACGGADFLVQPENWGDRASLGQTCRRTTLGRSEQTRPHPVSATKEGCRARCAATFSAFEKENTDEGRESIEGYRFIEVIGRSQPRQRNSSHAVTTTRAGPSSPH